MAYLLGLFYLTSLLCLTMVATDNSHNEVEKREKTYEQQIISSLESLKVEMQTMRSQLGKLSRRSKLMYSMMKDRKESGQQAYGTRSEGALCPPNFTLERHAASGAVSCYRVESERVSWVQARRRCRAWHARLVSIEEETEQTYLTNYFKDNREFHHCDFWTDGTDQVMEADWRWNTTNKAISYSHWHMWEPNNGSGLEHCMWLDWFFHWAWNDARCERDKACYVCELDITE